MATVSIHDDTRDHEFGVTLDINGAKHHFAPFATLAADSARDLGADDRTVAHVIIAAELAYLLGNDLITADAVDAISTALGFGPFHTI